MVKTTFSEKLEEEVRTETERLTLGANLKAQTKKAIRARKKMPPRMSQSLLRRRKPLKPEAAG